MLTQEELVNKTIELQTLEGRLTTQKQNADQRDEASAIRDSAIAVRESAATDLLAQVKAHLDQLGALQQQYLDERKTSERDWKDLWQGETSRLTAWELRNRQDSERNAAKEDELGHRIQQTQRRFEEATKASDNAAALDRKLVEFDAKLATQAEEQRLTAEKQVAENVRLIAWKDELEVQDLRLKKRIRDFEQRQEKLTLKAELGESTA